MFSEMIQPKISVVVPVYNVATYLEQCLTSIINQTLREIEIILIDDGSTDGSLDVCKKFQKQDSRIQVFTQKNKGAGFTRNLGIKLSKGEYISFLDSDDFFELDLLEKLYKLAKISRADISFCGAYEYSSSKNYRQSQLKEDFLPEMNSFYTKDYFGTLYQMVPTAVWCQLYNRAFLIENKIEYQNFQNSNDVFFILTSFAQSKKVSYIREYLVYHRLHKCMTSRKREESWKDLFLTLCSVELFLKKNGKFEKLKRSFLNRALGHMMWHLSVLTEPVATFWKDYFITTIDKHFEFFKYPEEYFFNNEFFKALRQIENKKCLIGKLEGLFEKSKEKIIPIVFAINNNYAASCAITIQSIKNHMTNSNFYDIYILHTGLDTTFQYRLECLSDENMKITCFNIKNKIPKDLKMPTLRHISQETYFRFLIPELFSGYDKVIYLDSDLVVEEDLAHLYDIDIGDNLIAGVWNPFSQRYNEYTRSLFIEPNEYINAGVLIVNIKQWKLENVEDDCWMLLKTRISEFEFMDQDILNIVCQHRIFYLDLKWNISHCALNLAEYALQLKERGVLPNQIAIMHYTSSPKPWEKLDVKYANYWWKNAKESPFYEVVLKRLLNNT